MNYRELGKTGLLVSEIGLGCEGFGVNEGQNAFELIDEAERSGINYFDLYTSDPKVRTCLGEALKGRRDKFYIQAHICSVWQNGQYKRTRDIDEVRKGFEELLEQLQTDYIDVGTIHYVDSLSDWEGILNGPVLKFIKDLKEKGAVKHIGLSSHNPQVALAAVESGEIDVLMFSVNPFYDLQPATEDVEYLFDANNYKGELNNMDPERAQVYETCLNRGVGITVMKAFGGGRLLDEKLSHVGKALTVDQALHYALTRPAVASVLVGAHSRDELKRSIAYEDASAEERDYALALQDISNVTWRGDCMYCGHCAPCPVGIEVASVTKFLNLTDEGNIPETVAQHYESLEHHAEECLECHACESRCPFEVEVVENMRKAKEVFGY